MCPSDRASGSSGHRLSILGPPRLEGAADALLSRVHQPRPLALLSVLGVAGAQGMTRDRLMGLLWSEEAETRARRHLSDALYIAHNELGSDAVTTSGATVQLNPACISTDVGDFRTALTRNDPSAAVTIYGGPLLDGFHLADAPAFEEWLALERQQCEDQYAAALEGLACTCEVEGDYVAAARWWHRMGMLDPLNSRVAVRAARALAVSGDPGNALELLHAHGDRLRDELGIAYPPEVTAAIEELRAAPARRPPSGSPTPAAQPDPPPRDHAGVETTPGPAAPPPIPASAPTRRPRAGWAAAVLVSLAGAAAVLRTTTAPAPNPVVLDRDLVAVIPFRVASSAEELRSLATFVPDLFWEQLSGEFGPRMVEPVLVVRAWRAAGGAIDAPLTDEEARAVARTVGAGIVLMGSVAGTRERLTLTATLQGTLRDTIRAPPTAIEGPYDSVRALVGGLATLLLAKQAGAPYHRYDDLARRPVTAAHAYLTGLRATRRDPWDRVSFDLALLMDSTLLIAGLAAYQAGEFDQNLARVLWQRQADLREPDRSLVRPLVGWRFGASTSLVERTAQFGEAGRQVSAREGTYAWASALGTWGHLTGPTLWLPRARAALEDVVTQCPDELQAWSRLFAIAMFAGDAPAARRYGRAFLQGDTVGDGPPFFAWSVGLRLALMDGDSATAARLWEEGASLSPRGRATAPPTLYGIHLGPAIGGLLVDGRGLPELDRFVEQSQARFPFPSFPVLNWARARGRSGDYDRLRELVYAALPPVTSAALRVRDALYLGAPEDSSVRAAAAFLDLTAQGAIVPPPDPEDPTPDAVGPARARCWSTLWRVAHGDTAAAREVVADLRERTALPYRYATCTSLIDVALARRSGGDLREALARLDSLDRAVPLEIWPYHRGARDLTFGVSGLVLARLMTEIGDTAGALAAARRSPWGPVGADPGPHIWLGMLPDFLREEARLAAAAGDTTGAIRAYRHYLTVRDGATGRWAGELVRARQEYATLVAAQDR